MKILMLGWELPPHNSGGLGVACYQLCQALAQKGVSIEFILPYTAEHDANFMTIHAPGGQGAARISGAANAYHSSHFMSPDSRAQWQDMAAQCDLYEQSVERLVEELEFDIIHAHDWLTFRAALRARELSGRPLIVHIHALERDRAGGTGRGNPFVREIEEMTMHVADRVVAVSQHTKDAIIQEYGVPSDKIVVVHNSIDLNNILPLDNTNSYHYLAAMKTKGYKVVVNVGRKTLQKGLPNLLRAAQAVVYRQPKTLFMLAGPGEQYFELIELAAELGISKNVLLVDSFLPIRKYWRDAFAVGDLFVMPSISEPFGITALEAIGYGTPVLVSKQSGVSEVLKNVLKVDFWDIDEMANQITAVLQNPALGEELLQQSLLEYNQMSWEPAADKLIDLYNDHVAGVVV